MKKPTYFREVNGVYVYFDSKHSPVGVFMPIERVFKAREGTTERF